jgi:predicted ATPase
MLKTIKLKNFRSFGECSVDFSNINILIGGNGSGKSNFISLFVLLNYIGKAQLNTWIKLKGGFDNIVYKGIQENDSIDIEFIFDSKKEGFLNIYGLSLIATEVDYLIGKEYIGLWDKNSYAEPYIVTINSMENEPKLYAYASNSSGNLSKDQYVARHIYDIIKDWKIYHFDDVSPNSGKKREQNIEDGYTLQEEGDNIAAFLYFIKINYNDNYQKIIEAIRLVAPYFNDFVLKPDTLNKNLIRLKWMEKGGIKEFSASLISDGTIRFICLAALLLQPFMPEIIIIDEPELGLHPLAIKILSELIKKASVKSQIITATQSVTLLNQFKSGDIMVLDKEKEGSSINRLNKEELSEWFEGYTLGELWEANYIGGRY